jgi:hypothetical protein
MLSEHVFDESFSWQDAKYEGGVVDGRGELCVMGRLRRRTRSQLTMCMEILPIYSRQRFITLQ